MTSTTAAPSAPARISAQDPDTMLLRALPQPLVRGLTLQHTLQILFGAQDDMERTAARALDAAAAYYDLEALQPARWDAAVRDLVGTPNGRAAKADALHTYASAKDAAETDSPAWLAYERERREAGRVKAEAETVAAAARRRLRSALAHVQALTAMETPLYFQPLPGVLESTSADADPDGLTVEGVLEWMQRRLVWFRGGVEYHAGLKHELDIPLMENEGRLRPALVQAMRADGSLPAAAATTEGR